MIKKKINENIRIAIADDYELFRDGLKMMLNSFEHLSVVAEAENGKQLIDNVDLLKPDVVITDISMPVIDGIDATKIISERHPQIGIIGLSMYDEDDLIIDMLESGARGYLLKNANKTELIEAIETVNLLNPYYCKNTSKKLVRLINESNYNPYHGKPKPAFKDIELNLIKLVCEQYTLKEIGEKLFISSRTLEGYKKRIMEKMKVTNTVGIAIYAVKNNLLKNKHK